MQKYGKLWFCLANMLKYLENMHYKVIKMKIRISVIG